MFYELILQLFYLDYVSGLYPLPLIINKSLTSKNYNTGLLCGVILIVCVYV